MYEERFRTIFNNAILRVPPLFEERVSLGTPSIREGEYSELVVDVLNEQKETIYQCWIWSLIPLYDSKAFRNLDCILSRIVTGDYSEQFKEVFLDVVFEVLSGAVQLEARQVLKEMSKVIDSFLIRVYEKLAEWVKDPVKLRKLMMEAPIRALSFDVRNLTGDKDLNYYDVMTFCNSGRMVVDLSGVVKKIKHRKPRSIQGSFYMTTFKFNDSYHYVIDFEKVCSVVDFMVGDRSWFNGLKKPLTRLFMMELPVDRELCWLAEAVSTHSILNKILSS